MNKNKWLTIEKSIIGSSHKTKGLPNQDSVNILSEGGRRNIYIASIADGHGSDTYFRSDIGSRIAVEVATDCLRAFLGSYADYNNIESIKNVAIKFLPKNIKENWKKRVLMDFKRNEKTLNLKQIEILDKEKPYIHYGTTLLAFAYTEKFCIYLQIGDGDILEIQNGDIKRVIPKNDNLVGNETTSLCMDEAEKYFNIKVFSNKSYNPEMIMLSTDGYSNSYKNDPEFYKVAVDILSMAKEDGNLDYIKNELEGWLEDTSKSGSGDDISAAILINSKIFENSSNNVTSLSNQNFIDKEDKVNSETAFPEVSNKLEQV